MSIIRGRIWNPKFVSPEHFVNEPLWVKCECGAYRDYKTGEHVELVTQTLAELMKEYACDSTVK